MPRKTLHIKVDELSKTMTDLTIKLEKHLTEFVIYKKFIAKVGYALLLGIGCILIKLFWTYIAKSPTVIANVIFNGTIA